MLNKTSTHRDDGVQGIFPGSTRQCCFGPLPQKRCRISVKCLGIAPSGCVRNFVAFWNGEPLLCKL